MQKIYTETNKKEIWAYYGSREKFMKDFPLTSTRAGIYTKYCEGFSLEEAIEKTLNELPMHEKAQRMKKLKHHKA